jgi:hypothetical protein
MSIKKLPFSERFVQILIENNGATDNNTACSGNTVYSEGQIKQSILAFLPNNPDKKFFDNITKISKDSTQTKPNFGFNLKYPFSIVKVAEIYLEFSTFIPKRYLKFNYFKSGYDVNQKNEMVSFKYNEPKVENLKILKVQNNFVSHVLRLNEFNIELLNKIKALIVSKRRDVKTINSFTFTFIEPRNCEINIEKCLIEININEFIVTIKIIFYDIDKPLVYPEEKKEYLKEYFLYVNQSLETGHFFLHENMLCYKVSYYPSFNLDFVTDFYRIIQKYIGIFSLHQENVTKICKKIDVNLQETIENGRNLRQSKTKNYIRKCYKLNENQILMEKSIYSKLMSRTKDFYFANRFNLRSALISEDKVYYISPLTGQDFIEACAEDPDEIIEDFLELINETMSFGIFFKDFKFEDFVIEKERIICKYNRPLNEIFETDIPDTQHIKYIEKIYNSLLSELCYLQNKAIDEKIVFYNRNDLKALFPNRHPILLDENTAKERLRLYQNNAYMFCVKYDGIMSIKNDKYLISSKKEFKIQYKEFTQSASPSDKYTFMMNLIDIIITISSKDSSISALSPECLGFCKHGKLKIMIKTSEEISGHFKAPEVQKGRVSKTSLVYSFGKIFYFMLSDNMIYSNEDFIILTEYKNTFPHVNQILTVCLAPQPFKRENIQKIKDRFSGFNELYSIYK